MVTALWAIGPDVLAGKFKAHDDEENVAEILATHDLVNNTTMQQACIWQMQHQIFVGYFSLHV
ncbi:hypothetical protein AB6F62_10025 [Providencia huaxiensis]|uniref:hypothetical protein n=1 Tax=Providencia huaxiensis TaxID=2027290 RepID=UPI0034DD95E2